MKRLVITIFILSTIFGSVIYAANEIRAIAPGVTTLYHTVREIDGDIWYVSGQVFEVFGTSGTMADYDVAMVDKSGGFFVGTMDTNIGAGQYYVVSHQQEGGSPADSDPAVWQEYGDWDGSIWTPGVFSPADIESEVNDALVALNLDHLMKTAVANNADMTTEVTDGTVLSNIMTSDSDTSGYVVADDALEALSDTLVLIKAETDLITALSTTVKDTNDANSFTLTAGADVNDAMWYHTVMVIDADDDNHELRGIKEWVYDGSDVVVLVNDPFSFTPTAGDVVHVMGTNYDGFLYEIRQWLQSGSVPNYIIDTTTVGGTGAQGGVTRYDPDGSDP